MTVLVTGGAGYVGSHTVLQLEREGFDFVVLDNLSRGHAEFVPKDSLVVGDIADRRLVREVIEEYSVTEVLHFAAFAYVGESVTNPRMYYENNVSSTLALLGEVVDAGVGSFVFSSTCATYGEPREVPISENHVQTPVNPYGASKLTIERVLREYDSAYGLRHVALRYFNAAGADASGEIGERHDPETHLIPLILQSTADKRATVTVFGDDYPTPDGTCVRDYIHVTDLASAHISALHYLKSGAPSDVFNLGNGMGYSVREVIESAQRVTGQILNVEVGPRRHGDPAILVGSCDKAREVLGWSPQYSEIDQIIESAWRWHRTELSLDGA